LVWWIEAVVDVVAKFVLIASIGLLFSTLLLNVILRYGFSAGVPGTQELAAILFPWLVVAGAVLAAIQGKQIAVDLSLRLLPPRGRVGLTIIINLIVLFLAVQVIDSAVNMAVSTHGQVSPVLDVPRSIGYASLVYGFLSIAIICLTQSYRVTCEGIKRFDGAG
jgi:TRAP-type C4-dicarboxylate transport system permease small subunit